MALNQFYLLLLLVAHEAVPQGQSQLQHCCQFVSDTFTTLVFQQFPLIAVFFIFFIIFFLGGEEGKILLSHAPFYFCIIFISVSFLFLYHFYFCIIFISVSFLFLCHFYFCIIFISVSFLFLCHTAAYLALRLTKEKICFKIRTVFFLYVW